MKKQKESDWDKLVKEQGWEKYRDESPRYSDMNVDERLEFIDKQLNKSYMDLRKIMTSIIHDTIRERDLNLEKTKDVLQESYDRLPQKIKDKLESKKNED